MSTKKSSIIALFFLVALLELIEAPDFKSLIKGSHLRITPYHVSVQTTASVYFNSQFYRIDYTYYVYRFHLVSKYGVIQLVT